MAPLNQIELDGRLYRYSDEFTPSSGTPHIIERFSERQLAWRPVRNVNAVWRIAEVASFRRARIGRA